MLREPEPSLKSTIPLSTFQNLLVLPEFYKYLSTSLEAEMEELPEHGMGIGIGNNLELHVTSANPLF